MSAAPLRAALLLAALVLSVLGRARAHDLEIDQVTLRPDPARGTLRGQVTFDPALTRNPSDPVRRDLLEPRVLAFLERNLVVEVDGQPLRLRRKLRELWVPAGATLGDTVMLDAALPPHPRELRVFAGKPFRALAVAVERADRGPSAGPLSTLVLGGEWTVPYRFGDEPADVAWRSVPPGELSLPGRRRASPPAEPSASRAGPMPRPPPPNAATPATGFAEESAGRTFVRYLTLGITHILPNGFDHVLFVVGLVLGAGLRPRRLLLLLSLFTLAHTLTLGLGALGWVVVPSRVVEPLIALSIAFIGVENLVAEGRERYRPFVVLAFGLIHGQGFAGALAETGLPAGSFLLALLSFNLGVELGQLAVVVLALALLALAAKRAGLEPRVRRLGSFGVALFGVLWTVSRIVG